MIDATIVASGISRLVRNLLALFTSQVISSVLTLIPITFLPVYLGAVGMGKLTMGLSIGGICSAFIMMGTEPYIVREIARERRRLAEILGAGLLLRLGLSVAIFPITVVCLYGLGYPPETRIIVLIMYVSFAIRMQTLTFAAAAQALEKMTWLSCASVLYRVIAVTLGWLVLRRGGGILQYVVVIVVADLVDFLVNVAYFVLNIPVRITFRTQSVVRVLRASLPFFLYLMLVTLYNQTGNLILARLGGVEAVGWFGVASQFLNPLFAIPGVALTVLTPRFSQLRLVAGDTFQKTVTRSINYMVVVTMPFAVGLGAISQQVIDLFKYPATFQHSVPVLRILATTLPVTSLLMLLAAAAVAMNKERLWAKLSVWSFILVILLNVILIPLAGSNFHNPAMGSAAAFFGAEILQLGAAIYLFRAGTMDRTVATTLGKTSVAAAVMGGAVVALHGLLLPLLIAAGAAIYVTLIILFKAVPDEDVVAGLTIAGTHLWPAASSLRAILNRGR